MDCDAVDVVAARRPAPGRPRGQRRPAGLRPAALVVHPVGRGPDRPAAHGRRRPRHEPAGGRGVVPGESLALDPRRPGTHRWRRPGTSRAATASAASGLQRTAAATEHHRRCRPPPPAPRDASPPRLLFTSSIAATMPGPYESTNAASKAFLYSFAQAIRTELKGSGVTVTALMPGPTDTNFFARAGLEDTKLGQSKKDDPAEVARDGFEALMAGKDHVVAGSPRNKAQVAAAKFLPDTVTASLHATMSKPGSGKRGSVAS